LRSACASLTERDVLVASRHVKKASAPVPAATSSWTTRPAISDVVTCVFRSIHNRDPMTSRKGPVT
jgi:hypothetical protein